jgi:3-oxoacyl-[acyl-carrier protein] reductase
LVLKNKAAIITGCSRGIGKSIVELFARNGADVWACSRKPDPSHEETLTRLSQAHGVRIDPVYFDLADASAIQAGMRSILTSGRNVDILVNNAGMVSENALFLLTPIATMRHVFEVNFFGQMLCTQLAVRGMSKRGHGSVVNVASIAAIDGGPGQLEYVASKAALIGATAKLARELAPAGIRVNAVAPGITKTDMVSGMAAELMSETLARSAMRAAATPAEIAQAILFLASDQSSHITGQVLRVDGGM